MIRLHGAIGGMLVLALPTPAIPQVGETQSPVPAAGVLPGEILLEQLPGRANYLATITREALAHGLPPAIADAVVRIESGYDPSAVGSVGEIGLMQVRPATAALLGFKGTSAELAEPETNIRYGVAYLAKAWRLADGDLCRALMKYRAGHREETMSPLSPEYCRRAKVHLAAIGWSPEETGPAPTPMKAPVRLTEAAPREAAFTAGPKICSPREADFRAIATHAINGLSHFVLSPAELLHEKLPHMLCDICRRDGWIEARWRHRGSKVGRLDSALSAASLRV